MTRRSTDINALAAADRPIHAWYRLVLSFPPHLVRDLIDRFGLDGRHTLLDPFSGAGTTLVEGRRRGLAVVGLEANPVACFACRTKLDWSVAPTALLAAGHRAAAEAHHRLAAGGVADEPGASRPTGPLRELPAAAAKLLVQDSISPLPLHKVLTLLAVLADQSGAGADHLRLALASVAVHTASNLRFGPEVGLGQVKSDAAVIGPWLAAVEQMAADLGGVTAAPPAVVHAADARAVGQVVPPVSIDAVITSPPYPNEKDYTRATRLETVLLGYATDRAALRALKQGLVRSNSRGVYVGDDDDQWVAAHPEIEALATAIEARRLALGKTSGFERLYARVTRLYFGGLARHLADLRPVLRSGARLAYVVGDQASFLRVPIATGRLLADLAGRLGYEVEALELFRLRRATATRQELREEIVLLRWPGGAEDGRMLADLTGQEGRAG